MKKNDELLTALKVFIDTWEDTYSAEEEETFDPLKELNDEVQEFMELQGFTHWQTGGGCTAWGKHILGGALADECSPYVMVTMYEASAYFEQVEDQYLDGAVMMIIYDIDGTPLGNDKFFTYTWEEFTTFFAGGF